MDERSQDCLISVHDRDASSRISKSPAIHHQLFLVGRFSSEQAERIGCQNRRSVIRFSGTCLALGPSCDEFECTRLSNSECFWLCALLRRKSALQRLWMISRATVDCHEPFAEILARQGV